jgi:hypothetical protein
VFAELSYRQIQLLNGIISLQNKLDYVKFVQKGACKKISARFLSNKNVNLTAVSLTGPFFFASRFNLSIQILMRFSNNTQVSACQAFHNRNLNKF